MSVFVIRTLALIGVIFAALFGAWIGVQAAFAFTTYLLSDNPAGPSEDPTAGFTFIFYAIPFALIGLVVGCCLALAGIAYLGRASKPTAFVSSTAGGEV